MLYSSDPVPMEDSIRHKLPGCFPRGDFVLPCFSVVLAFQADHTNMSGNVMNVHMSKILLKCYYISGQNGTAVYHYVRKYDNRLSLNLIYLKYFTFPYRVVLSAI